MPNIKSQIKRMKQAQKQTLKNKKIKAQIKTHISNFNKALVKKDEGKVKEILDQTVQLLDKAASKGVIHKNKAANKKSKLMKKFNAFKTALKEKAPKSKPVKSSTVKSKTSSK